MKGMAIALILVTAVALSAAQQGSIPRTGDGHPDLQGTWSYATLTTLERPAEFKDKPVLSAAEAAAFVRKIDFPSSAIAFDAQFDKKNQ